MDQDFMAFAAAGDRAEAQLLALLLDGPMSRPDVAQWEAAHHASGTAQMLVAQGAAIVTANGSLAIDPDQLADAEDLLASDLGQPDEADPSGPDRVD